MISYVADFETTTKETDCHVWAFAICEVGNKENVITGTTIDEFMRWCETNPDNSRVFFHNLKFDGQFIISWLLHNGFKHTRTSKEKASRTFNTLISDKGFFYSIEVIFQLKGKRVNKIVFRDSLKLIPMSVAKIAETFKLPIKKLEIDYDSHNELPLGAPLTAEEKAYIINDVQIVAYAIEYFYSQGLDRMTIGSCALEEYKSLIGRKAFDLFFPVPKYHNDVRQSYRGGYTYVNPQFEGKIVGNGIVLDVNSLYPYVMYKSKLPFGTPIFFKGEYKPDKLYPLYIQMISCQFELKPGKIPTVQIKHSMFFKGNEYLTSSEDEIVTLCLNSVDLELFFEHYNVYNLEFHSGWKFKARTGLFDKYIEKWSENKIKAKEEGNPGLYLISKLFLNSLYGKFGTSTTTRSKIPELTSEGFVRYKDSAPEEKDGIYIAMASFITSYGRQKTITSFQTLLDNYNSGKSEVIPIYCDTDSLHCFSPDFEIPEGLEIHDTKLGAWKIEGVFNKAKFLRPKCYIENFTDDFSSSDPEFKLKVTVAGMPEDCADQVNFKNFKIGATYTNKKQPEIVKGGVILKDIDFTIQK